MMRFRMQMAHPTRRSGDDLVGLKAPPLIASAFAKTRATSAAPSLRAVAVFQKPRSQIGAICTLPEMAANQFKVDPSMAAGEVLRISQNREEMLPR